MFAKKNVGLLCCIVGVGAVTSFVANAQTNNPSDSDLSKFDNDFHKEDIESNETFNNDLKDESFSDQKEQTDSLHTYADFGDSGSKNPESEFNLDVDALDQNSIDDAKIEEAVEEFNAENNEQELHAEKNGNFVYISGDVVAKNMNKKVWVVSGTFFAGIVLAGGKFAFDAFGTKQNKQKGAFPNKNKGKPKVFHSGAAKLVSQLDVKSRFVLVATVVILVIFFLALVKNVKSANLFTKIKLSNKDTAS